MIRLLNSHLPNELWILLLQLLRNLFDFKDRLMLIDLIGLQEVRDTYNNADGQLRI